MDTINLFGFVYGFGVASPQDYNDKKTNDEGMVSRDIDSSAQPGSFMMTAGLYDFLSVQPAREDAEEDLFFYHGDHLGSTAYITDASGIPSQHVAYIPFGEVLLEEKAQTWQSPYKFNCKELDEESGLYYYGARYYDPKKSFFYGVDAQSDKYPSWSPFTYCLNNPVKLIDLDGNSAGWPIWKRDPITNADAHISTNLTGPNIVGHQTLKDKVKSTFNIIGGFIASRIKKIGGGGDVLTTSRDVGVSGNNRQGDGSNSQNNVDILSAAIGAAGSDGRAAFRIPMKLEETVEKIGQLVDGIGILNNGVEATKEMKGKFQYIIQSVKATIQIDGTPTSKSHRDTVNPGDPLPGGTQHDTIKIID